MPLKRENRGRRPRFPFKGEEEKSSNSANFSTRSPTLLDAQRTIALFLFNNPGENILLHPACRVPRGIDLNFHPAARGSLL